MTKDKPKNFGMPISPKPWSNVVDGWMRNQKIRRDCMIFLCIVLVLVLLAVVLSGPGALTTLVRIAASPITWITGGTVLLGGGGAVVLRRRSRRHSPQDADLLVSGCPPMVDSTNRPAATSPPVTAQHDPGP